MGADTDRIVGKWWARQGSNLRASGYEPGALPLSYGPPRRDSNRRRRSMSRTRATGA